MVDGCRKIWLTFCQEFRRALFWARYCSSCTSKLFLILENKLIGYDDDATLLSVVPSPGVIELQ